MFDRHYLEWSQKRAKCIIDFFGGATYFQGKKILDCAGGHGDIGAVFYRLGGKVNISDVRPEHIKVATKKYPGIQTQLVDYDKDWPHQKFDLILDLGLICHLRNFENHLRLACNSTDALCLETAVCDSDDPDLNVFIQENKNIYDLAYNGFGSYPSAAFVEKLLTDSGFAFQRFDDHKMNVNVGREQISYDWHVTNSNKTDINKRRMWIAMRSAESTSTTKSSLLLVNNTAKRQPLLSSSFSIIPAIPSLDINKNSAEKPGERPSAKPGERPKPGQNAPSLPNKNELQPQPQPRRQQPLSRPKAAKDYFIHTAQLSKITAADTSVIRLFYNYYEPTNPKRKEEINYCLQKNLDNHLIDVVLIDSQTNPTYQFLFDKINNITGPNDINILCHSDIFFDETINLARSIKPKQVYALTSWTQHHANNVQFYNSSNNQDSWIVRGPIENVKADFKLGKDSADNRLIYEFAKAGYKIFNPSKSIKTNQVDNYNETKPNPSEAISGPHVFIEPTELQ